MNYPITRKSYGVLRIFIAGLLLITVSCKSDKSKEIEADIPDVEDVLNQVEEAIDKTVKQITEETQHEKPAVSTPVGDRPIRLTAQSFKEPIVLTHQPGAEVDYIIDSNSTFSTEVTIEPGVIIEFTEGSALYSNKSGSISAIGTANEPIILRGEEDLKGYWQGVYFRGNKSIKNKLEHVHIQNAGSHNVGAALRIDDSRLSLESCKITNSLGYGINIWASSTISSMDNCTVTGNEKPMRIDVPNLSAVKSTNSFKGNDDDYITVYGGWVEKDATWNKIDVTYRLSESIIVRKAMLTIMPGVTIEFPTEGTLKMDKHGALVAEGTANEPIVFTGTTKMKKSWRGIYFDNTKRPENKIAFAEFHYSGIGAPSANIYTGGDSMLEVHDIKFIDIDGCAINPNKRNPNMTIGENITSNTDCAVSDYL